MLTEEERGKPGMLLRVYRLNDIMIHDNDNCTDARGGTAATILNCNIRKWRLNATALSLRREFFTGAAAAPFINSKIRSRIFKQARYFLLRCLHNFQYVSGMNRRKGKNVVKGEKFVGN